MSSDSIHLYDMIVASKQEARRLIGNLEEVIVCLGPFAVEDQSTPFA